MPGGCADNGSLYELAVEKGENRHHHTERLSHYTPSPPVSNPTASPWQAEPSIYATYRSSPNLPKTAQVCIIGTGLSGISIAHHLLTSDPSISVTLLEARTVCSAASGRNGGHLTCDLYSFAPALLRAGFTKQQIAAHAQFELDNFDALTALIQETQIECEYRPKKHHDVCFNSEELESTLQSLECMRQCDGPLSSVKVWTDPATASELVGVPCEGVVEHTYSASINPYKLVTGMLERLMEKYPDRLTLYTRTLATKVDGSTIYTDRGSIQCEKLVFATNGYTSTLLPALKTAIVPVRGQVISQPLPGKTIQNCTFSLGGEYLSQRPTGSIILGGARRFAKDQEVGNSDDSWISPLVSRHLHQFANRLNGPRDSSTDERWEWSGVMGYAKLGIPLVMRMDKRPESKGAKEGGQTFICAGFTGHGMPRIYLSAKHLSNLILQGPDVLGEHAKHGVPSGYEVIRHMTDADLSDH